MGDITRRYPRCMSRKYTARHLVGAFAFGLLVGGLAVKKGCPPVPVPADTDPPPVTVPATSGAK